MCVYVYVCERGMLVGLLMLESFSAARMSDGFLDATTSSKKASDIVRGHDPLLAVVQLLVRER